MSIILASQSPRRRELLGQMGISDFIVRPAAGEESVDRDLTPAKLVEALSRQKAQEVAAASQPDDLIIAADTVVSIDGQVLGKPAHTDDAFEMLSRLSGRTHTVLTGVTVCQGDRMVTGHESTKVQFRNLTAEEICAYIATGEPMDKAGAYGIQGLGALLVEGIKGDYSNVVGLPICKLGLMLKSFGVDTLALWSQKEE